MRVARREMSGESMKTSRGIEMTRWVFAGAALVLCLAFGLATSATATVRADDAPPVTTITDGPAEGSTTGANISITFQASVPDATFECRLDSAEEAGWAVCSSPWAIGPLAEGPHTAEVRATDLTGAVEATPPARSWTVDATAPVVTVDSGPAAHTTATDAEVTFSVDDQSADVECRYDSTEESDWGSCQSPVTFSGLSDGQHMLEIRATDAHGNVSSVAGRGWNVDTDLPEVTIDSAPPALNNSVNATFAFSADESGAIAECRLDPVDGDSPWIACDSPAAYTGLADGPHRFEVRVTDPAGNVSPAVGHDWTIATVKPVAGILNGPADPTDQTTASFDLDSDNPAATFQCRLDAVEGTEWIACNSPVGYTDLAHGEHTFEVRAVETDQGAGPVATYRWSVDTVSPTVELTGAPAPISGTADPVFGFAASEPGTTAECRLDPADQNAPWGACVSPTAYTGLADGPHRFEVRVTDPVGHVSEPTVHSWIVETIPPGVTITSGPENPTTEISAWFNFSSENENAGFQCRLDGGTWNLCQSGVEYGQLADGQHTFEVRAVGQGAGPGAIQSRTWTVDTVVPALTVSSRPHQPTNETTAGFTFAMNKPGFTFRCQLDAEPATPCSSPLTYSGLAAGDHTVLIEALDDGGEVVDSELWNWAVLAARPVASITAAPPSVTSTAAAVLHFESDVPEASFECRVDGGTWSSCASPAGLSGLSDGPHAFAVRAGLPGSPPGPEDEHLWTVDTTAPDLLISGGPGLTTKSDSASFAIASDDPTATTECRLDEGPWAACGPQLQLVDLADGAHVLRARATDQVGNTGFSRHDWTIDRTAPVINLKTAPPAVTSAVVARFGFTADDPDATFECRLDGGAWKACSSVHEVADLSLGSHDFALRATDRLGNVSEPLVHTWRVNVPPLKGLVPSIKVNRKVKLDRRGAGQIAIVTCPEGRCRVIAPRRITVRVGGRKFSPGILAPRTFYRDLRNEISLAGSARASRLLQRYGPVTVKIQLTVVSDNGKRRPVTAVIRLTGK